MFERLPAVRVLHHLLNKISNWSRHVIIFGIALCLVAPIAAAQNAAMGSNATASAERVKAAFLYRFIAYVEWPATSFARSDSPYVIGIVNADDIAEELAGLVAGRQVNNRPVTVKRMQASEPAGAVHVLFIGPNERSRQAQLLKQLQQQPVLLVTDSDGAINQGSMINFRMIDDRVRFEVALAPIEQSGLKISSRMLAVALAVTKGTQ